MLNELVEIVPAELKYVGEKTLIQFEVINMTMVEVVNGSGVVVRLHIRFQDAFYWSQTYQTLHVSSCYPLFTAYLFICYRCSSICKGRKVTSIEAAQFSLINTMNLVNFYC